MTNHHWLDVRIPDQAQSPEDALFRTLSRRGEGSPLRSCFGGNPVGRTLPSLAFSPWLLGVGGRGLGWGASSRSGPSGPPRLAAHQLRRYPGACSLPVCDGRTLLGGLSPIVSVGPLPCGNPSSEVCSLRSGPWLPSPRGLLGVPGVGCFIDLAPGCPHGVWTGPDFIEAPAPAPPSGGLHDPSSEGE